MPTSSRRTATVLTALALSVCAPVLLAVHPHTHGEAHDKPAHDMQVPEDAAENAAENVTADAPLEIVEIIQIEPEDLEGNSVSEAAVTETGDFDINDFLGADGMVDVEKLRAYENGKQDYIAQNSDSDAADPVMQDSAGETDVIILNQPGAAPAGEEAPQPPTTYDYGSYIAMPPAAPSTAGDTIERMVDKPEKAPKTAKKNARKSHPATDAAPAVKDTDDRGADGQSSSTFFGDILRDLHKSDRKEMRKKKRKKQGRTITLSGETTVHIAPDGAVTITNNGDAVVPLKFDGRESGKASAMVIDNGRPAKVTVNKDVTTENGKRKVRLEVEMESDIVD